MGYVEDFRAKMDRQMKELTDNDTAAKEAGTLVGRFIRESIADGYAYYVIVSVDQWAVGGHNGVQEGEMCNVEHVDYCDGYRVPMIESMGGKIPVKYARENIAMRDSWEKLFKKHKGG